MKKEVPLVSVILPTYNREKTIERAIKSVLNQTYKNWELIIIDDGSTDNTKEIVKYYLEHKNINYFYQKNKGVCAARNLGIKRAKGKFLAFLDSDDEFLKEKLKINLLEMINKKVDFILCNFYEFRESRPAKKRFIFERSFIVKKKDIVNYRLPMSASYMFVQKKIARDVLFDEDFPSSNDFDFVLRCSEKGSLYFLNDRLVNTYKTFGSNRISTNYKSKIEGYKMIIKNIKNRRYKLSGDFKRILLKRSYFNLAIFYLFSYQFDKGFEAYKKMDAEFLYEKKSLKHKGVFYSLKYPSLGKFGVFLSRLVWNWGLIQN